MDSRQSHLPSQKTGAGTLLRNKNQTGRTQNKQKQKHK